jgi:hypothetical protein
MQVYKRFVFGLFRILKRILQFLNRDSPDFPDCNDFENHCHFVASSEVVVSKSGD